MKKIKLTEKDLTKIIQKVVKEQRDPEPDPDADGEIQQTIDGLLAGNRKKFLDAYGEMSSHILNMFYYDKQDIRSHDANKTILGFKKIQREIDREMMGACKKYEEAKRYFRAFSDKWIYNE